ncbi:MAG: hypothetical protein ACRDFS_03135 [Chloroflexota bacterium]
MAQQSKGSGRSRLLLIVLVVVAALGLYWFHSSGVSHSAPQQTSPAGHHAHSLSHRAHAGSHHAANKSHRSKSRTVSRQVKKSKSGLSRYAANIVPILDSSSTTFNQAAGNAASKSGLGAIGSACNAYTQQISLMSQQFNGVPHPAPWYWKVGRLHHKIAGVYHNMLGNSQACQTAAGNGDYYGAATAVSGMSANAQRMQSLDRYAHWLARQR